MLTSIAWVFLLGMASGALMKKLHLPALVGYLIAGILLGPYVLNVLDSSLLLISADIRKIALVIILARAGLALDINDLKKVGRPAILMCFVPACFEIVGMIVLAPALLGISVLEAAIMGAVVAAVSPAVVVPKMLRLMENGYGTNESIPQMIMAGAAADDVFVIVLFTAFTSLAQGEAISPMSFAQIPISVVLGLVLGIAAGLVLTVFFKRVHIRDSAKVIIVLSVAFLLIAAESSLEGLVPVSGLLAVMSMGIAVKRKHSSLAERLSVKLSKLWVAAEIMLFVLVGATVDISYAVSAGVGAIIVIFFALAFRMLGVLVCLMKTKLRPRERLFCMVAYCPKATVQAAIGSLPLAMGLSCGSIVLTVAVLAILITAPLGALGVDITYKKWLAQSGTND